MAAEEDIIFRINYQLQGVERSISTSRRALYTLNAVRLSIRDIQQVLSGPTIANFLFTAIQLTRTLTHARRLTKALAAEQGAAGVTSLLGAAGTRGVGARMGGGRAFGIGQFTLQQALLTGPRAGPGFFTGIISSLSTVGAFAIANPIVLGAVAIGGGLLIFKNQENRVRREYRERNREIAKAQGLEP